MKVLTILGSPKANGNTEKVLEMLEQDLALQKHTVKRVRVTDWKINGCLGCNGCFSDKNRPNCTRKDDAMAIFDEVMAADAVIYASPLYAWSFPAQMKAFIDRHYCCITNPGRPEQSSVLEGKRVALLITCSEPMENNADVIQTIFDRIFLRLHCIISGKYIVESSSAPDFEQRARKTARQIAGDVTAR